MNRPNPAARWIAGAAVILYAGLGTAAMLTREPWCDEAWFNGAALNLATKGYMGTPYLDPASNIGKDAVRLDGVDRYTYWMTPLYMVVQAAWFKVVGFGLVRARVTSLLWGLLALGAWWTLARRVADQLAASVSVLLIAVEYHFITRATSGRMDIMCAALGVSGLAAYFALRERHLDLAMFLANASLAAAIVTHPIAVIYGLGLVVAAVSLDRGRLRWGRLIWCVVPYLVAMAGWSVYIAKAPQLFKLQFLGNATGRGPGPLQPWEALKLEIWHRYGENFGMASWTTGPARVKILVLALYLAGLAYVAASRNLRSRTGSRTALLMSASVIVFCWLFEGTKTNLYLPHILPWFCLMTAIAVSDLVANRRMPAWMPGIGLLMIVCIQASATILPATRNAYRRQFLPAMGFLRQHAQSDDTMMSDAVAGFVLGFDRTLVDDAWFGYRTGKKTDWLVMTPTYFETVDSLDKQRPEISRHVTALFNEYRPVYSSKMYRIYVRKSSVAAMREF